MKCIPVSYTHLDVYKRQRIRLARNIEKLPMPYLKNESSSFTVLEKTRLAYEELNLKEQGYEFYNMRDIPSLARQIMTEKHLISPEFAVEMCIRDRANVIAKEGLQKLHQFLQALLSNNISLRSSTVIL